MILLERNLLYRIRYTIKFDNRYLLGIITAMVTCVWFISMTIFKLDNSIDPSGKAAYDFIIGLMITLLISVVMASLKNVVTERPPPNKYLKYVHYDLNILGITLNDLHARKDTIKDMKEIFGKNTHTKCFRFLLLHPYSSAFDERAMIEGKSKNILRIECLKSVRSLDNLKHNIDLIRNDPIQEEKKDYYKGSVEYRFYDVIPGHGMIITDETGWVGPFLYKKAGTQTKWFQILNLRAYGQYLSEFDEIWELKKNGASLRGTITKDDLLKENEGKELFLISKHFSEELLDALLNVPKDISDFQFSEILNIAKDIDNNKIKIKNIKYSRDNVGALIIQCTNEKNEILKEIKFEPKLA